MRPKHKGEKNNGARKMISTCRRLELVKQQKERNPLFCIINMLIKRRKMKRITSKGREEDKSKEKHQMDDYYRSPEKKPVERLGMVAHAYNPC
jgi:hypothetical protein